MPHQSPSGICFEAHGTGDCLFLGPPLLATTSAAELTIQRLKQALIDDLGTQYKLLFVDYPYGRGGTPAHDRDVSAERATQDLIEVADAAGVGRFTWHGYSWGAVLGFQLALQTDRLAALVAGGFPPVDGPYAVMLETCRRLVNHPPPGQSAQFLAQYSRYYESLQNFSDKSAVARISVPRLIYAGSRDVVDYGGGQANIGAILQSNQKYLERLGWQVRLVPGKTHSAAVEADVVLPILQAFLRLDTHQSKDDPA